MQLVESLLNVFSEPADILLLLSPSHFWPGEKIAHVLRIGLAQLHFVDHAVAEHRQLVPLDVVHSGPHLSQPQQLADADLLHSGPDLKVLHGRVLEPHHLNALERPIEILDPVARAERTRCDFRVLIILALLLREPHPHVDPEAGDEEEVEHGPRGVVVGRENNLASLLALLDHCLLSPDPVDLVLPEQLFILLAQGSIGVLQVVYEPSVLQFLFLAHQISVQLRFVHWLLGRSGSLGVKYGPFSILVGRMTTIDVLGAIFCRLLFEFLRLGVQLHRNILISIIFANSLYFLFSNMFIHDRKNDLVLYYYLIF